MIGVRDGRHGRPSLFCFFPDSGRPFAERIGDEKKKNYALDDALSLEADDVLSDNSLIKLVLIVCSTDPLESYKDQLFNLYKSVIAHNPEVIDIELVQTKNVDDPDLSKMLNNLPAHYDDEFERFDSVVEYYSIKDLNLTSCDELFRR